METDKGEGEGRARGGLIDDLKGKLFIFATKQ